MAITTHSGDPASANGCSAAKVSRLVNATGPTASSDDEPNNAPTMPGSSAA